MTHPLGALAPRQRELVDDWLPGIEVEADMSWQLVETTVLRARAGERLVVVKAGGASDHHIEREIRAHREWTGPWVRRGRAARMLHADVHAKLLVTEYLPGTLVQGTAAVTEMDTYVQAGELLRACHAQAAIEDPDYEPAMNAKALAWLTEPIGSRLTSSKRCGPWSGPGRRPPPPACRPTATGTAETGSSTTASCG